MKVFGIIFLVFFLSCGKEKEPTPVSIPSTTEKENLQKMDKEEPSPTSSKPLSLGPHIVDAPSGLMLRSQPSKDGVVIVKMLNGMRADVLEYSQNEDTFEGNRAKWAKVKYKKYTGWAFSHYLKPDKGAKPVSE